MAEKVKEAPKNEKKEAAPRGAIYERDSGVVTMHMILKTDPGESKLEWTFKAISMVAAVTEAKRLCAEHRKRWPQDVIVWDN